MRGQQQFIAIMSGINGDSAEKPDYGLFPNCFMGNFALRTFFLRITQ